MSVAKIVVTSPAAIVARGDRRQENLRWFFLGKDVLSRRDLEQHLGPRASLGTRVPDAARDLRQPFLDAVAQISINESGRLAWWGTSFSWKVWGASDLFLLLCYHRVGSQLVADAEAASAPLMLVVEDPWLLAEFRRSLGDGRIEVTPVSLGRVRLKALALGLMRRVSWLSTTIRARRRQSSASRRFAPPTTGDVAIYSMPLDRCLRPDGEWNDPFLANIDELVAGQGRSVRRFGPPESTGFEDAVAERHAYFHPLITYVSNAAIVRALAAWWRPSRPLPAIDGIDMRILGAREWWTDVSRANWCRYALVFESARAFFARNRFSHVVYPFENQPWEKMLVAAARAAGVKTIGVQHSTLSIYYLSYFLGRGEDRVMPVPDEVLASGKYAFDVLTAGGYPSGSVKLAGSLRYRHLTTSQLAAAAGPRRNILIALPIDRPMAEHLVAAVGAAFPDAGAREQLKFFVKAHPSTPVDPSALGLPVGLFTGSVDEAVRQCGTVIFTGTTLGPELAAQGLSALRYRPQSILNADVSEGVAEMIPECGDEDLRVELLAAANASAVPDADRAVLLTALFARPDVDVLTRAFKVN